MDENGATSTRKDTAALSRAFTKQRQGKPLDSEEAAALKEYNRRRVQLRTDVYWLDFEEKSALERQAEAEGFRNFSKWVREKVYLGINHAGRPGEEWQRLESQVQALENRLTQQLEVAQEMAHSAGTQRRLHAEALAEIERLRKMEPRRP